MSNLRGRVFATTGCASGIGLATAKLLASKGAKVSLADVEQSALDDAANVIRAAGGEVLTVQTDVRKLDGAVNLAGVTGRCIGRNTVAKLEDDDWDFVLAVNLTGLMSCLRTELQNTRDGGSIVNASSIAGLVGRKKNAAYAASNHGVSGLAKSAALDLAERQIRVNAIAPGTISTPMVTNAREIAGNGVSTMVDVNNAVPLKREGTPEEAAKLIAFLLSDDSSFITGGIFTIAGGLTA